MWLDPEAAESVVFALRIAFPATGVALYIAVIVNTVQRELARMDSEADLRERKREIDRRHRERERRKEQLKRARHGYSSTTAATPPPSMDKAVNNRQNQSNRDRYNAALKDGMLLTLEIPVTDLRAGMIVGDDMKAASGSVILARGALLDADSIQRLKDHKITNAYILFKQNDPEAQRRLAAQLGGG